MSFIEDLHQTNFVEKIKELEKEIEKIRKEQNIDYSQETSEYVRRACVETRIIKAEQEGESAKIKVSKEKAEVEKLLMENAEKKAKADKERSAFYWSEELNLEKCAGEIAKIRQEVMKNKLEEIKIENTILYEEEGKANRLDIQRIRWDAELKQIKDNVNSEEKHRLKQDELRQEVDEQELREIRADAEMKERERKKQNELQEKVFELAKLKYDIEIESFRKQRDFENDSFNKLQEINTIIERLNVGYPNKWWCYVCAGIIINMIICGVVGYGLWHMEWELRTLPLAVCYLLLAGVFVSICVFILRIVYQEVHYYWEERKTKNELKRYWEDQKVKLHPLSKIH